MPMGQMRSTRRSIAIAVIAWVMALGLLFAAAGTPMPQETASYDAKVFSIETHNGSSVGDDGKTLPRSVDDHRSCVCLLCRDCGPCAHPALIVPFALHAALNAGLQQPGDDAATAGATVAGYPRPPRA